MAFRRANETPKLSFLHKEADMNITQLVREFCVRKLAQILYDNVECSVADRALLDWTTAEVFVDAHRHFVDRMSRALVSDAVHDKLYGSKAESNGTVLLHFIISFADFERVCGRDVWDDLYQPFQRLAMREPYTRVRFG